MASKKHHALARLPRVHENWQAENAHEGNFIISWYIYIYMYICIYVHIYILYIYIGTLSIMGTKYYCTNSIFSISS